MIFIEYTMCGMEYTVDVHAAQTDTQYVGIHLVVVGHLQRLSKNVLIAVRCSEYSVYARI